MDRNERARATYANQRNFRISELEKENARLKRMIEDHESTFRFEVKCSQAGKILHKEVGWSAKKIDEAAGRLRLYRGFYGAEKDRKSTA
jgi:hypothetical protein